MRMDFPIAGLALAGALYVAARHPLAAALTMALGMGFGLAALTIEPATTRARSKNDDVARLSPDRLH